MSIECTQSFHKLLNLRRLEANPCSLMLVHVAKPTLSEIGLQYRDWKVLAIWPFAEPQDRYRFT